MQGRRVPEFHQGRRRGSTPTQGVAVAHFKSAVDRTLGLEAHMQQPRQPKHPSARLLMLRVALGRVHMFSDEAGDFTFRTTTGASKYFIIATVTLGDCSVGDELQALQRELAWQGVVIEAFHASHDRPSVRNKVYDLMAAADIRIDATALEKPKTEPHIAQNHAYFYKLANFLHFKYVIPRVTTKSDDLMVVASSLQMKKKKEALHQAVRDVVYQVSPTHRFVTAFLRNDTDPCLQLADYAAWAVQRKLERGDAHWYNLIDHKISSVFEPFSGGVTTYYK